MIPTIKNVLVAMDLTEMDDTVLSFVRQLSEQVNLEKVYLTHIIPHVLAPAETELTFHQMFSPEYPIGEKIRDVLLGKSDQFFKNTNVEIELEVAEGKAYNELLTIVDERAIDLLVVGNKKHSEGSGITARRMARKAKCNILFVPEETPVNLDRILVPIDFSKNSARALKTALKLRQENTKVTALNVIEMLQTDYYFGLSASAAYRSSMQGKAEEAFVDFKNEYISAKDEEILNTLVIVNESSNTTTQLKDFLKNHPFDLVVMGAKGHTPFENFLMGSVTESFVSSHTETPILIIR